MARILVTYDTIEGQTRKISEYVAARVTERGHKVSIVNVAELSGGPIAEQFDGAIVGASIHVGKHSKRFVEFLESRRMWLDGMPVAFFSVSLSASGTEEERREAQGYVKTLLSETGWQPYWTTTVGGALRYRRYNWLKRIMMRKIASKAQRATDTSRDHEYTDWRAVDRFADSFLAKFPPSVQE